MSAHRLMADLAKVLDRPLVKTATATLTILDVNENGAVVADSADAVALTLPAASSAMAGRVLFIGAAGAGALTIVVTAGLAGVGAGGDTLTLAQGAFAILWCGYDSDGWNWFGLNATVAA